MVRALPENEIPPRFTGRYLFFKHRTPYPNPPQPTKNGIFLCCRACHTSVCLHPSALKTSRFMIAFGLPFFWFDFSSGRGKSAEYTGVCASILTMSWRKSVQKNGFVCCALCLSIRELNTIWFSTPCCLWHCYECPCPRWMTGQALIEKTRYKEEKGWN